jgi:AraC family transcriptional regulator
LEWLDRMKDALDFIEDRLTNQPESFAKAFRKAHGLSPSEARSQGAELKAYPQISFHISIKGDTEMDYKIVNRNAFPIIGKAIQISCKDGGGMREIPEFWSKCQADGTIERLASLFPRKNLLGIKMDFDDDKEEFTYVIAVEGTIENMENDLVSRDIPATTWSVFPSVGALPKAIQDVWLRIYQEWFPVTGYQHAESSEMEVYPLGDTTADNYRCEVWIPVVKD